MLDRDIFIGIAANLPDEELSDEAMARIWKAVEKHIKPRPMRRLLNYIRQNLTPVVLGMILGIIVAYLMTVLALSIYILCNTHK
jgi:hypothetical protein